MVYDNYGNTTQKTDEVISYLPTGGFRIEVIDTINVFEAYDDAAQTNWWIDKLLSTQVTKTVSDDRKRGPNDDISVTTLPHTTNSKFIWVTNRQLECQYTYLVNDPGACNGPISLNSVSRNSFDYDNYGNITGVTTKAKDDSSSSRSVTTNYTSNNVSSPYYLENSPGYFPAAITKEGLITSYTYIDEAGQVERVMQPDGNYTVSGYDSYGFKIMDKYYDNDGIILAPSSFSNIRNCWPSNCSTAQDKVNGIGNNTITGMLSGSPRLKYQTEQRQDGQPHVLTWYDSDNNPVITQTYHTDYDNDPTLYYNYVVNIESPAGGSKSTQPFQNTSQAYPTLILVDALGRAFEKQTSTGDLNAEMPADCNINTMYDHIGSFTDITVTSDCANSNNSLSMSRIYDATGKLLSTEDAMGNKVKYWYDASGNPLYLQDALGNYIETDFDALGRKLYVNDPNMGNKNFDYNGFGEVIQQTDAQGNETYYSYDRLGRITDQYSNVSKSGNSYSPIDGIRSYKDHYSYDPFTGNLDAVDRQSNKFLCDDDDDDDTYCFKTVFTKILDYDNQNRLKKEETNLPAALTLNSSVPVSSDLTEYKTEYYYDSYYNRLKQVVYDERYSIENQYTKYGSLEFQIDVGSGIKIMTVDSWNYKGQETKRKYDDNTSLTSTTTYYPSTGQIEQITNTSNFGSEVLDYQYDIWGNIKTQELTRGEDAAIETFTYDDLHRLKTADINNPDPGKTYDYDEIGNIKIKSDFSMQYVYENNVSHTTCGYTSAPGPNAVKSASLVNGTEISYHYDARGNRISDCKDDSNVANYTYDYNNLLIESNSNITGNSQILEFNYGADNQRYRKYDMANNEITLYANKDYEQIYKGGVLTQSKYYITSYMTITKDYNTGAKRTSYMQKDRLGSTTQILDDDGDLLHTKSYDAFGKPRKGDWSDISDIDDNKLFKATLDFTDVDEFGRVISPIDISKRGFTDHEHLDEMQLIHMNGRMYDYNNGRFLSVDPFIQSPTSTQSMNPYTYIFNNPLSGTDPSGYIVKLDEEIEVTNVEQFAPSGSRLKTGTKVSGHSKSSGDKFSISFVGGKIASSSGLDFSTTKGPSTGSGKGISDTGKQSNINKFTDVIANNASEIVQGAVNGAIDQLTDETSQKIAKIEFELWAGGKVISGIVRVVQWTIRARRLLALGKITKLDLFGGKVSQLAGEGFSSVDIVAVQGVRASTKALPFKSGSISEIVASGPQATFLPEAARVLKSGGQIFINATKNNQFFKNIGNAAELEALGLKLIQQKAPLLNRFKNLIFRRTDGTNMGAKDMLTTVLEKL